MQFETKILGIIMVIMFIVLYNKTENMSNTDIKKMITDVYQVDVDAIRNLSKMANDLTINNSLKVPGGLNVEGPLNFLPRGTIVAFNGTTAPTGWAICDGKTVNGYKTPDLRGRFIRMHSDSLGGFNAWGGKLMNDINVTYEKTIAGNSRNDTKAWILRHNFGNKGGTDHQALIANELPSHGHSMNFNRSGTTAPVGNHSHGIKTKNDDYNATCKHRHNGPSWAADCGGRGVHHSTENAGSHSHTFSVNIAGNTANTGANWGHNNQPPYYVLTWIVKII